LASPSCSLEPKHALQHVRADGERAATIVRHLLAFARRSALERSIADLNEIARSTLALRTYELRTGDIAVQERYEDELPLITVNREEIQQVVLNLILNAEQAIKATGLPGKICVRTGHTADSAFLEVADDGPGVPAALANRIFEPFFTTKSVGEGTGLGLSVSFGIAEAHGGSLSLASSGRGACFTLKLPLAAAMEMDSSNASVLAARPA
jgi:signal transduction histidine kinase